MSPKKVALACQGGGTHAAFTWGVLTELLGGQASALEPERTSDDGYEVVALSGTSAGALCALAAWYGLVPNKADPSCGTSQKAIERLDHLWDVFSARNPTEWAHNLFTGQVLALAESGAPFPRTSPYAPWGDLGLKALRAMGARPEYLGFAGLLPSLCPDFESVDWNGVADRR